MQSAIRSTITRLLRSPVICNNVQIRGKVTSKSFAHVKKLDNIIFKPGATLPYTTQLKGGMEVRYERVTKDNAKKAYGLLRLCIDDGAGYSADELEPYDEFVENAESTRKYFVIVDPSNNEPMCLLIMKPCPLARNENTVHFSALITVSPEYRGKGFGHTYLTISTLDIGRTILGHPGVPMGRTTLGRGANALQYTGANIIGTIPNCSYLTGIGRMTDVIFCALNKDLIAAKLKNLPEPTIPPLVISDEVPTSMQSDKPVSSTWSPLVMDWGRLDVELASPKDVWRVEEMIRQAAQKGDGFGLDEFNSQGHFNRKLLYESTVVVAKTADDVVMCAAIFGPSKLCRAVNPTQIGGYIIVNEDFRNKGIGNAFTEYLIGFAKEHGYTDIMTDVYLSNSVALNMMTKNDFFITGSVPHCAYVKGKGYTESLLHYINL